jgi:hypothetical protein
MRYIYPSIEQLDLSGAQLHHRGHPSFSRFSLILTDNIIELILHRQCQAKFQYNDLWERLGAQRYPIKFKAEILGQHFDKKVWFCRKIGKISSSEQDFINIAHRYRNELYHSGIKYDDIIYDLAWHYHALACLLFARLRPNSYSWSSKNKASAVVRKYIPDDKGHFVVDIDAKMDQIARSLAGSKPSNERPLPESLSNSAISRLERVQEGLELLVEDNPGRRTEPEVIEDLQFFEYLGSNQLLLSSKFDFRTDPYNYWQRVGALRKKWKPRHRTNPLPRFMLRAKHLSRERNPTGALQKFEKLRQDMAYFEKLVEEAAAVVDAHIQMEIDRARGR